MTMRLFTHTIVIDRPREAVFDFFTDFTQAPNWRSYVRSMQLLSGAPVRAGSRLRVLMDVAGGEYSFEMDVLTCERPALWRHRTHEGEFNGYIEYRFDPEGNATRVTMSCVVKPMTIIGWLALPRMWLGRKQMYRDQLPKLKRTMEEAGAGSSQHQKA